MNGRGIGTLDFKKGIFYVYIFIYTHPSHEIIYIHPWHVLMGSQGPGPFVRCHWSCQVFGKVRTIRYMCMILHDSARMLRQFGKRKSSC